MGKTKIDNDKRTGSFSQRAKDLKISVIKRRCPFCCHHKALAKGSGIFCSRCKKEIGKIKRKNKN